MAEPVPAKVKRTLYRGDSRKWTHVFTDAATGVPIDITGWSFLSQYREDLNRGNIVATATCAVTDGPAGTMVEELDAVEAENLPGQTDPAIKPTLYWDLQSTDTAGMVRTWMYARVPVSGDASDV